MLGPALAPYSVSAVHPESLKFPPLGMEGSSSRFLLGTDDLGRDFFSRLIYGARYSIGLGLLVAFLSVLIGGPIGLIAGWCGGKIDRVVVSAVDIMMSFPGILLAIVIVAILGPGLLSAVTAVTVIAWPGVIRVVRGETIKEKNKTYITALKSFGGGGWRGISKHILPNVSGPLIVQTVFSFSEGVLNIAALGFLGLGVQPPLPEWGVMISDGRDLMTSAWWMVTLPGICVLLVVLCVNILGGALRDTLDPRS